MNNTKGSAFFIQSLITILFATGLFLLVFVFWPQNAQSVLPWIYSGLGLISGVLSLAGTWHVAKNFDEKNEDKAAQCLKLTVLGVSTAIVFQIVSAVGFMI